MAYDLIVETQPTLENMGLSLLWFLPVIILVGIVYYIQVEKYIIHRYFTCFVVAIMIIALLGMTIPQALYIFDYKNGFVNQKTKPIVAYRSDKNGVRIFTDKGKAFRIFRENKEKFEDLDEAFINHTCEIYYYRLSKYVYRIVVHDEGN